MSEGDVGAMPEAPKDATSQRTAVSEYLTRLVEHETRYRDGANWYCWWAGGMQISALLATAATTVLAGIYEPGGYPGFFLVALPATATFILAVRAALRLSEIWRVREEAAIEFRGLAERGRQRFAAATGEAEYGKLHRELEAWARRIERQAMASATGSVQEARTGQPPDKGT